jgi:adenosylmethionine-8-amino-7-oxononanoate aminotransferase
MGAVLAPNEMVATLAAAGGFNHGHTYFANPLSCAVAYAVVTEMLERDLITNAARMGARLHERLGEIQTRSTIIGDVRGKGLLMAMEIVADKATKAMLPLPLMAPYRLADVAMERGLLVYARRTSKGMFGDWLMIAPPLITTEAEIDEIADLLAKSVSAYEAELSQGRVLA